MVEVDGFEPTTSSLPASICKRLISVTRLFSVFGTLRSLHIMHQIAGECNPLQVDYLFINLRGGYEFPVQPSNLDGPLEETLLHRKDFTYMKLNAILT